MNNQTPTLDPNQKIDTNAYVPTYTVRQPEFKEAVEKVIATFPYNQVKGLITLADVEVIDQNRLTNLMNALSQLPYQLVSPLLENVRDYITQDEEE